MPVKVVKKTRENSDQLLVNFNRKTTRAVRLARRSRYLDGGKNALKEKTSAIVRERNRAENARKKFYE